MNYKNHYDKLIIRAQLLSRGRTDTYCEQHHIIPRCIGGLDTGDNLVLLTPEEHYIAHLLLVKIYPLETGLIYAANIMANRNNKQYGWIKRKFSIQNSIDHTGMYHTKEAIAKMKLAIENRKQKDPELFLAKQRYAGSQPKKKKDGYFKPKSKQHAANISSAAKKRPRYPCNVCGKQITKANIQKHMRIHVGI